MTRRRVQGKVDFAVQADQLDAMERDTIALSQAADFLQQRPEVAVAVHHLLRYVHGQYGFMAKLLEVSPIDSAVWLLDLTDLRKDFAQIKSFLVSASMAISQLADGL